MGDELYSGKLHSLVLPTQTFTARIPQVIYTESTHPHSLCIWLVWKKFHSENFIQRVVLFWNRCLKDCYPDHYNLNFFNSRVSILHIPIICASYPSCSSPLLWMARVSWLGEHQYKKNSFNFSHLSVMCPIVRTIVLKIETSQNYRKYHNKIWCFKFA